MIGQSVGAYTDATHGMTLSAVSLPYYRLILPCGLPKFRRYAVNVWDVRPEGKTRRRSPGKGWADGGLYARARAGHERPGAWGHFDMLTESWTAPSLWRGGIRP